MGRPDGRNAASGDGSHTTVAPRAGLPARGHSARERASLSRVDRICLCLAARLHNFGDIRAYVAPHRDALPPLSPGSSDRVLACADSAREATALLGAMAVNLPELGDDSKLAHARRTLGELVRSADATTHCGDLGQLRLRIRQKAVGAEEPAAGELAPGAALVLMKGLLKASIMAYTCRSWETSVHWTRRFLSQAAAPRSSTAALQSSPRSAAARPQPGLPRGQTFCMAVSAAAFIDCVTSDVLQVVGQTGTAVAQVLAEGLRHNRDLWQVVIDSSSRDRPQQSCVREEVIARHDSLHAQQRQSPLAHRAAAAVDEAEGAQAPRMHSSPPDPISISRQERRASMLAQDSHSHVAFHRGPRTHAKRADKRVISQRLAPY